MSSRVVARQELLTEQITTYTERIAPLGVQVHRVSAVVEASELLRELAIELSATSVLVSSELLDTFPSLSNELGSRGVEIVVAGDPVASRDAPLGLTTARHAIAETGSVLMSETTLADRSVGLLSLVLAVILPSSSMLGSLDDAARVLRAEAKKPGGAYTTLVTGPSRTADIELSLTVGVQGPGRVLVIFVDVDQE